MAVPLAMCSIGELGIGIDITPDDLTNNNKVSRMCPSNRGENNLLMRPTLDHKRQRWKRKHCSRWDSPGTIPHGDCGTLHKAKTACIDQLSSNESLQNGIKIRRPHTGLSNTYQKFGIHVRSCTVLKNQESLDIDASCDYNKICVLDNLDSDNKLRGPRCPRRIRCRNNSASKTPTPPGQSGILKPAGVGQSPDNTDCDLSGAKSKYHCGVKFKAPCIGLNMALKGERIHLRRYMLHQNNIGHQLLVKQGWQAGQGLGKTLQGRVDPVPIVLREEHMGFGRLQMELEHVEETTERRRLMECEKENTEELQQKYKENVERERARAESLAELKANFYCNLCDKQYTKHTEYDNHVNSYDHAHKQRLKELHQKEIGRTLCGKRHREEKHLQKEMMRINEFAQSRVAPRASCDEDEAVSNSPKCSSHDIEPSSPEVRSPLSIQSSPCTSQGSSPKTHASPTQFHILPLDVPLPEGSPPRHSASVVSSTPIMVTSPVRGSSPIMIREFTSRSDDDDDSIDEDEVQLEIPVPPTTVFFNQVSDFPPLPVPLSDISLPPPKDPATPEMDLSDIPCPMTPPLPITPPLPDGPPPASMMVSKDKSPVKESAKDKISMVQITKNGVVSFCLNQKKPAAKKMNSLAAFNSQELEAGGNQRPRLWTRKMKTKIKDLEAAKEQQTVAEEEAIEDGKKEKADEDAANEELYPSTLSSESRIKPRFEFLTFVKSGDSKQQDVCNTADTDKRHAGSTKTSGDQAGTNNAASSSGSKSAVMTTIVNTQSAGSSGDPNDERNGSSDKKKQPSDGIPAALLTETEGNQIDGIEVKGMKKLLSYVEVTTVDEQRTLQWPAEMIQVSNQSPRLCFSCNPLHFDYGLLSGKPSKISEDASPHKKKDNKRKKKKHSSEKSKKKKKKRKEVEEVGQAVEGAGQDEVVYGPEPKKPKKKKVPTATRR